MDDLLNRHDLTDEEWQRLVPLMPGHPRQGHRWNDHRTVINGILFRTRTGCCPWRDLPPGFGNWNTTYGRHRRWSLDGTWGKILDVLRAGCDQAEGQDWTVSADSTVVRAHQHAAGTRRARPAVARGRYRMTRIAVPGDREALGRSRSGLTTMVRPVADRRCRPITRITSPGQHGDCPEFIPLMDQIRIVRRGTGRPRTRPGRAMGDKAYSSKANRAYLRRRGIQAVIPVKDDQKNNRRGRAGGRPPAFDTTCYRDRNTVERCFAKLKQFRAVAIRYDKRELIYQGTLDVASIRIWLREQPGLYRTGLPRAGWPAGQVYCGVARPRGGVIYPQRRRGAPPGSRAGQSPPPQCLSGCACSTTVFFRARTRTTGRDGDVMPELPFPPDLDQLRRQARELLRAVAQGEPDALARLHAVSDRVVLSAAQLAVAREYGFRSWPALKAAVERDRSIDLGAKPPAPVAVSPDLLEPPEERRSFGGAAAIETAEGALLPELLVVGPGHAVLDASLVPSAPATPPPPAVPRRRPLSHKERLAELDRQVWQRVPTFDDVTVTDDQGTTYALKVAGMAGYPVQPDAEPRPVQVRFWLEPAPARETAWIELRAHNGPTTRLVPAPRAAVHVSDVTPVSAAENELADLARGLIGTMLGGTEVGLRQRSIALARAAAIQESEELDAASELPDQLARLCASLTGERPADDLPPAWSGMLSAANRSDGPACHLDIAAALPPLHGVVVQVDSLVSRLGGWKLYLRARPGWFIYSEDRMQKWDLASVHAEDDLGGGYISSFGGSTGHPDHEELALDFLPPLDPRARRLTLTLRATGEQHAVAFHLPSNGRA